jgi:integrase
VGKSKTKYGSGRFIPLNRRATEALRLWAERFPDRKPEDYVFAHEKVTAPKKGEIEPSVYDRDPSKPTKGWKNAWTRARKRAGIWVRFHDIRHTAVTKMVRGGIPLPVIGALLGWSAATLTLMIRRYAHVNNESFRQAVALLEEPAARQEKQQPEPDVAPPGDQPLKQPLVQ